MLFQEPPAATATTDYLVVTDFRAASWAALIDSKDTSFLPQHSIQISSVPTSGSVLADECHACRGKI
jgi:hypothetical protein